MQEYWDGDIPWITRANFTDGQVILGRRYINRAAVDTSATNIVPKGSILLVTRTSVGKIAIAPVDIAISQDITGIVLKQGVDPKFVIAAIRNRMNVILAAQRGATIKGVVRKDVESLSIPLPAPAEQRRIVEILDQADALRKKRAEADARAALILPTLFYKIFGDPATNPKRWEVRLLGDPDVADINPRFDGGNPAPETEFSFVPMTDVDETWGRIVGTQTRHFAEVLTATRAGNFKAFAEAQRIPVLTLPVPLLVFGRGFFPVLAGMVLWGTVMGMQETIMRAAIAEMAPTQRRGFAYGIFNTAYGAAWFLGSVIMGVLYDLSIPYVILFSVILEALSIPLLILAVRKAFPRAGT